MALYKEGNRYLRNKNTGAVFQFRDSIAGLPAMELLEADANGELQAVENREPPDTAKLNPTKTPEKKEAPKVVSKTATPAKQPTMVPAEPK